MKAKRVLVRFMVGSHRALFTLSTALLGVSASLVADNPHEVAHFFFLTGALLLMYVEDECGEIEVAARALSAANPNADSRTDIFETHNSQLLIWMAVSAVSLIAIGAVLLVD